MSDSSNSFTQSAINLALGVVGGAITTLVAFRTRLSNMQRDIGDANKALEDHAETERMARERLEADLTGRMDRHEQDLAGQLASLDRRQMAMLKIVVSVARKVGVDNREFDDALVRMLTDEAK